MLDISKAGKEKVRRLKTAKKATTPNPTLADAKNYAAELTSLNVELRGISKTLKDMVADGASAKKISGFLSKKHNMMTAKYSKASISLAPSFVDKVDKRNKFKNEKIFAKALGLKDNELSFIDTMRVTEARELAILENVQLIKSIPQEYFGKVADAISRNFRGLPQEGAKSLAGRLQDIGGITTNRSVFIARDQTAKVNSALTHARHQAAGVDDYSWQTAKDNRVVGTPGGKWPKASQGHGNHYKRQDDIFSYSKPPADGHPGQAYNCRCKAVAIIDPRNLIVV